MMLRYSLNAPEAANAIEQAVSAVLDNGLRTADIQTEVVSLWVQLKWVMLLLQRFK